MSRMTRTANSAMMASLVSHLLCCGLPAIVNFMALFAGLGTLSAMAPWVGWVHDFLHRFELGLLLVSALALAFGVWAHKTSAKRDCNAVACHHEPCAPKKRQSKIILMIAGALFAINLTTYIWHQVI